MCSTCKTPLLTGSFYKENNQVYCERDYIEQFIGKCDFCKLALTNSWTESEGKKFHDDCFERKRTGQAPPDAPGQFKPSAYTQKSGWSVTGKSAPATASTPTTPAPAVSSPATSTPVTPSSPAASTGRSTKQSTPPAPKGFGVTPGWSVTPQVSPSFPSRSNSVASRPSTGGSYRKRSNSSGKDSPSPQPPSEPTPVAPAPAVTEVRVQVPVASNQRQQEIETEVPKLRVEVVKPQTQVVDDRALKEALAAAKHYESALQTSQKRAVAAEENIESLEAQLSEARKKIQAV